MRQLNIKETALLGFGAVFITFIITIMVSLHYFNEIESLEKEATFYEKSYTSLFEFKYYTERLLTSYNLKEERIYWLNSKNNFDQYFKTIIQNQDMYNENFINFWNVIDNETKKIDHKLQNPLFHKKNTQERSLLRRLGEGLNANKSSDYYLALFDLKNSIDYIKQYEVFLLEELEIIKSQKIDKTLIQIETAKKMGSIFIAILVILSLIILYYVVTLVSKMESRLHDSLIDLQMSNRDKELLNRLILDNYEKTLFALVDMIEERDTYTGGHSQRVAEYSVMIAKELGYKNDELKKIHQAGVLHDIGKMNIPDSVLLKPGQLNDIEYQIIQSHAQNGYKFLKQIPMYQGLAEIIHYHHERYDGKGYPTRKGGEDIPMVSYILGVADAFDAMTTNRIYRSRKSVDEALAEIKACAGRQFHPEVAIAAIKALKDVQIDASISQTPHTHLELERFSYYYKDKISNTFSEEYLDSILNSYCQKQQNATINLLLLHNFAQYNHRHGWKRGNRLLFEFAKYLNDAFEEVMIFRVHGDDFVVLSSEEISIDESLLKELDIMQNSGITLQHCSLNLRGENICNFKDLESVLDNPEICNRN